MNNKTVDELLHDAARAHAGLWLAQSMGDTKSANHLIEKRDRLLCDAAALDPEMTGPEWDDDDSADLRALARKAIKRVPEDNSNA